MMDKADKAINDKGFSFIIEKFSRENEIFIINHLFVLKEICFVCVRRAKKREEENNNYLANNYLTNKFVVKGA